MLRQLFRGAVGDLLPSCSSSLRPKSTNPVAALRRCCVTSAQPQQQQQRAGPGLVQALPVSNHSVRVVWDDRVASQYNYVWLRDNCRCSECMDPGTQQKLIDTAAIPLDTQPRDIVFSPSSSTVQVLWSDGHCSTFEDSWLRDHAEPFLIEGRSQFTPKLDTVSNEDPHLGGGIPRPLPWTAEMLEAQAMFVDYGDLQSSDADVRQRSLLALSNNLQLYGLAYLKGVPCEENYVLHVANTISLAKKTCYGDKFDVIQEAVGSVSHLAYSGKELDMHTDLNYREKSPGLQFLHCMELSWVKEKTSVPGDKQGLNIFVDGFAVTEEIRRTDPSAFHVLSSTPVNFSMRYKEHTYTHQVPIICMGSDEEVQEVHLSNRSMAPLQLAPSMIMPFYSAYKRFNDLVRDRRFRYMHQLQPGELVIFNNRRVMHGRTAYDPTAVKRRLQGCYSDLDEFMSKYRSVLLASQASGDTPSSSSGKTSGV